MPTQNVKATDALTSRQQEIIRFVAEGLTNREIAAELRISVRTAEVHRFNLMRRLRVRNVAQLLRAGLSHGLIPGLVPRRQKRHQ